MSRNLILATGALLWGAFAVDAIIHFGTGDWIAPTVAMIVGATWIALRRMQRRLPETA
jgi:hypothetical protein